MTLRRADYKYYSHEDTSVEKIGRLCAEIEIVNSDDAVLNRHGRLPEQKIRRVRKTALVNSGAAELVINEEIKQLLDLRVREKQTVRLSDESLQEVDIVGPIEVRVEDESATVKAIVLPGAKEVLLGRIPMFGLHLFIDPENRQLCVLSSIPINKSAAA